MFRLLPFLSLAALLTLRPLHPAAVAQNPPANPAAPAEPAPDGQPEKDDPKDGPGVKVNLSLDRSSKQIVQTGAPVHVKTNEVVPSVVVIQSSATIDGRVDDVVVVIGGEAVINGTVGGDVVNVGGGIVLGPNAHIEGNAVGILGGVQMGPDSIVDGDAVGIVGGVRKAPGAHVGGETANVSLGNWGGHGDFGLPDWLKATFTEIVLKLRLLSFRVGWVWVAAGLFLALHALLIVAAPGAVNAVVSTLSERGATAFLMGLLALPLAALFSLILLATGVGIVVIPFLWAAVFFAGLVGKAGLLQFFGTALGRGAKQEVVPLVALLIGAALLSLLYLIPFLGLLFWMTFALWALGAALLALFGRYRKESPAVSPASPGGARWTAPATLVPSVAAAATVGGETSAPGPTPTEPPSSTLRAVTPGTTEPSWGPAPLSSAPPTLLPEAATLPRVGFRGRFLATLLDWLLLFMVLGWIRLGRIEALIALAYFVGFWVWRQTTVGGIVLRLRVARLDGRPVDVATALVRALGALFGGLALGIGYFWSGWDPEKQGWHDKIAGTVVVKLPKTQPLV